jgi:ribosomal protein S27AE
MYLDFLIIVLKKRYYKINREVIMVVEIQTLFCSVCGDRCQGDIHKRIMCRGCGNGIMIPVKGSLIYPEE